MKDLSDCELEQEIKKVVCELVESVTPPPVEESWARFEAKLKAQHYKPKKHFLKLMHLKLPLVRATAAAGIAVLIVGLLSCVYPAKARAIGERIVDRAISLLSGTQMHMRTGYRQNEPGQAPLGAPNEAFKEVAIGSEAIVSLDEARARCPFPITIPKYLPSGNKLGQVKLQELIKPVVKVAIDFTGPDSRHFSIVYLYSPVQYGQGFGYDIEDTLIEDFKVKDIDGKIAIFKNNTIKAMWISQGVVYTLEGNISKEDALKIIKSM